MKVIVWSTLSDEARVQHSLSESPIPPFNALIRNYFVNNRQGILFLNESTWILQNHWLFLHYNCRWTMSNFNRALLTQQIAWTDLYRGQHGCSVAPPRNYLIRAFCISYIAGKNSEMCLLKSDLLFSSVCGENCHPWRFCWYPYPQNLSSATHVKIEDMEDFFSTFPRHEVGAFIQSH